MRPLTSWTRFDLGLAVIAALLLAVGLWGVGTIAGALSDVSALQHDCALRECYHHGTLINHSLGVVTASGRFTLGAGVNFCILTMDLDVGRQQTAVTGSYCGVLVDGSAIDAEIWRSQIVAVRTESDQIGTYLNPELAVPVGLFRSLALLPALLVAAMIRFDVMNRHVMPRLARRRRSRDSGSRNGAS